MKKIALLLAVLLILSVSLIACNKNKEEDNGGNKTPNEVEDGTNNGEGTTTLPGTTNTPDEPEKDYTFVELEQTVKVYALTALNLRERPSFAADVAKKSVPAGTELVKIAESNESSIDSNEKEYKWFKVTYEEKEYYVKSTLVTTIGDPGEGFSAIEKSLYAKGNLKVRSVPDLDTEAVGYINQGDAIKIVGVNEKTGWYQIEFESKYTPKGVYYVVSDAKWWSETPVETDAQ